MNFLMEILRKNQVSTSILTSQGVALFVDSTPHVLMTFGISLKEWTIQLGLNKHMINDAYKIIYSWESSRQPTVV